MKIRCFGLTLAAAALLAAAPAAVMTAPAAVASTTAASLSAKPAGTVIFGPCTALEDGRYMVIGHNVYECVHTGFGWYWVRYVNRSCPGVITAGRPAACG
jgi:hypothetical protein